MPKTYAAEFRRRVIDRVRSGHSVRTVADELELCDQTIYRWMNQDAIDRGEKSGISSPRPRGAAQGTPTHPGVGDGAGHHQEGLVIVCRRESQPKRKFPVIAALADEGYSLKLCCRLLGVAASGYFVWKRRSPSARELRRAWLTNLIADIHHASRGTYGPRRVRAELVLGHGLTVSKKLVARIMRENAWKGLPMLRKGKWGTNFAP